MGFQELAGGNGDGVVWDAYSKGRPVNDGGIRSLLLRMGVAHEAGGGDQSRCQRSVKAHIVNNKSKE